MFNNNHHSAKNFINAMNKYSQSYQLQQLNGMFIRDVNKRKFNINNYYALKIQKNLSKYTDQYLIENLIHNNMFTKSHSLLDKY